MRAPKEWNVIEPLARTEYVASCRLALSFGNDPMLDTNRRTTTTVRPARDVAGSVHALRARFEILVDDHTVVDAQSGILRQLQSRPDADADDDEIRGQALAATESDRVARNGFGGLAKMEHDAVLLVQRLDEFAEIAPHDALQRRRLGGDDVDRAIRVASAERRGHLETDEAGAEHDDLLCSAGGRDQSAAVAKRAEVVHVRQIGTFCR